MKQSLAIGGLVILIVAAAVGFSLRRRNERKPADAPGKSVEMLTDASGQRASSSSNWPRVLGTVPEFTLVDQQGSQSGSDQLRGKVWVANFIFTRCQATCPRQTSELSKIQQELADNGQLSDVRLVSISVDPEFDRPDVLADYAKRFDADPESWKFLTGKRQTIWELSRDGFRLPVDDAAVDSTSPILHSPQFVLIDRHHRIRGYYDGLTPQGRAELKRDMERVLSERKAVPAEILNPPWLESRRRDQLATVGQFSVFYDFQFEDRREESGITFSPKIVDDAGRHYKAAHYDHGNGIAVADVDSDGHRDLYFVTQAGRNELWRNLGDGRFEDITAKAGVAVADRIGVTASFADVDNDGDADLFVTTVRGGNVLFLNSGDGTFTDVTAEAGLGYSGHSSGAVFFDYDRDGLLDLFLTNVGKYTTEEVAKVTMESVRGEEPADDENYVAYPDAFAGHLKPEERNERSILYHNEGGHRFTDATKAMGLIDVSWSGDATPIDRNRDGWPDLYVLSMQGNDEYYENEQGKRFVRRSREFFPKTPWGAMGIKSLDYDNDGDFDLMVTDMHSDMVADVAPEHEKLKNAKQFPESMLQTNGASIFGNAFFENQGDGTFEEVSDNIGAENYWPWGLSTGDLNADGFEDVFVTSSMNYPFRYGVNSLLLNNLGQRFLDSEFILGVEPRRDRVTAIPYFECDCDGADKDHLDCEGREGRVIVWSAIGSRSSAILDLDDDGDLDIVTNDFNSPPMVLISNLSEKKSVNSLQIRLVGNESNRDGLGAVVKVTTPAATLTKAHDGQSGYLSHSRMPLYFGLGDSTEISKIEIDWPSGTTQVVESPIEINTLLEIEEPQ